MTLVISKGITLANSFAVEDYMWNNPRAHGLLDVGSIGDPFEGGFYAGVISYTANGEPTHALIVAPRATGATGTDYTITTSLKWADETVAVPAHASSITTSQFDGKANTDLMMSLIANGTYSTGAFPAAAFCDGLSIAGFNDWYLPARFEIDIAYFYLKPNAALNNTSAGINPNSVPERTAAYTTTVPPATPIASFKTGGSQAFPPVFHWSSTQGVSATAGFRSTLETGFQGGNVKTNTLHVRAFRRIEL